MLGQVIKVLAEKASGKAKGEVVPYRNSALTRMLQNALGGNSKTIMICAISPAFMNYEETLSTLRYADNAKKIKNSAVVNESPSDRMIRELKAENLKLKEMLVKLQKAASGGGPVDLEALGLTNIGELIEDMTENEKIMEDLQKPFEEKLAEAKAKDGIIQKKKEEPSQEEEKFDPTNQSPEKDDEDDSEQSTASSRLSLRHKRRGGSKTISEDRTHPYITNLHVDP